MTRETKIGLLVGLGFIIVFGLLLGDRTQLEPTIDDEIAAAGDAGPQAAGQNPLLTATGSDSGIEQIRPPEVRDVRQPIRTRQSNPIPQPRPSPAQPMPPVVPVPTLSDRQAPRPEPEPADQQQVRQPELNVDYHEGRYGPAEPAPRELAAEANPRAEQTQFAIYTVRPGDSLRKIAGEIYGDRNAYTRIFDANRDQLNDPANIYVNQRLRIPNPPARPARVQQVDEVGAQEYLTELTREQQAAPARTYTVQAGDNLWRIARSQMNDASPAAVDRLFEANRDVLSSPDMVRVGMTLRIPR